MDLTQLYLQYQPLFIPIYLLLVSMLSLVISLKVKKLYDLSLHRGIKLFGLAFLFFSIAFFVQFIFSILMYFGYENNLTIRLTGMIFFNYLIALPGFYIVYSLVRKEVEENCTKTVSNLKVASLHIIALIIAIAGLFFPTLSNHLLFIPQLLVLAYGLLISYQNYQATRQERKNNFLQMYFIAMVLWFTGYLFNYLQGFVTPYLLIFPLYVQLLTLGIFIIFFYGVIKVTSHN